MRLSDEMRARYLRDGHLTVPGVFEQDAVDRAVADLTAWGAETLAGLAEDDRAWYLERGRDGAEVLRKLDQPVFHRPLLRALAAEPELLELVAGLLGPGPLAVHFSQVFLKPAGGGPKPPHQDNHYFGPNHADGLVTAWIALDDADVDNGCMEFADGSHRAPLLAHRAPADRPFDLQVADDDAARLVMTPAPVPRGGVSFHHGGVLHRSGANPSGRPRRAMAVHYVDARTVFATPALPYDGDKLVRLA